jgi:electron transport complex protein RnfG
MNQFLKTAGVLALVCFVSGFLLSLVNSVTREAIMQAMEKKKDVARALVLPAALYSSASFVPVEERGAALSELLGQTLPHSFAHVSTNYVVAKDEEGNVVGYIFDVITPRGYGGDMVLIVGIAIRPNDTWGSAHVSDYSVISSSETPGLGTGAEQAMHAFFTNRPLLERKGVFDVDPSERQIDSISGATITSVAIKDALAAALQTATLLMKRDWVNLSIPNQLMYIIPNAHSFERVPGLAQGAVREVVDVRWYGRTSGYLLKIFLHDEESQEKKVGLAGFTAGGRRLHAARLFAMPERFGGEFVSDPHFRSALFSGRDPVTWFTNAALNSRESNFAHAVFEGHALLRKEGRLP